MSDMVDNVISQVVTKEFTKKVLSNIDVDVLAKELAAEVEKKMKAQIKTIRPSDFEYIIEEILEDLDINPIKKFMTEVIKENFS